MNNKSILLYLVIILIFLLCVKNYLFKKHNIETFTNKKCISSSYQPEPIQLPTFSVKPPTSKVNPLINIFSIINSTPTPTPTTTPIPIPSTAGIKIFAVAVDIFIQGNYWQD